MNADLRASLVAAGAAAFLSSLVGLIAGVGFLALALRALVGGLFFGAATYGLLLLARRFLPGLVPGGDGEDAPDFQAEQPERGAKVDIVLPAEGLDALSPVEGSVGASGMDLSASTEEASLLEPDGLVSETEAAIPPSASREGAAGAQYASLQAGQGSSDSGHRGPGFEDLDVLPDLDGFTDSFAASEFGARAAEPRPAAASSQASSGASSGARDGMDPAALAQAVRTILKRDQKG